MRVQIVPDGAQPQSLRPMDAVAVDPEGVGYPASYRGWRPRAVLGADSAGGLLLPTAEPTSSQSYAPRGVHLDDDRVVVCDTGNHRVLVFDGHPDRDGVESAVVLGQPHAGSEGPQAGGRGADGGMNLPTGVLVDQGRLVVADAWNHRILIWRTVPTSTDTRPDVILGQPTRESVDPNAGGAPSGCVFYWPFGIAVIDGRFYVTDTGNRRVLVWLDGIPDDPATPAEVIIGQDDAGGREENRGGEASGGSFRWPHDVVGDGTGGVLIADAGNHRALGWLAHPDRDRPADYVLGQPDMTTAVEFPYQPQTGTGFRFPYAITAIDRPDRSGRGLALADTANNRVLVWDEFPHHHQDHPDAVLGQPTFAANGENRWERVDRDTLCWPYGLASWTSPSDGTTLIAVADSGNNRVVLWSRP